MGAIQIGITIYFTISAALLAFGMNADGVAYLLQQKRWQERIDRAAGKKGIGQLSDRALITMFMIIGFAFGPILAVASLLFPDED